MYLSLCMDEWMIHILLLESFRKFGSDRCNMKKNGCEKTIRWENNVNNLFFGPTNGGHIWTKLLDSEWIYITYI